MHPVTPAAVYLRELHRQALFDTVARERLAATAVSGPAPQDAVVVSPGLTATSWRTELVSWVSRYARVAAIMGRPLSRSSLWS